jgi:hypothetical protein
MTISGEIACAVCIGKAIMAIAKIIIKEKTLNNFLFMLLSSRLELWA